MAGARGNVDAAAKRLNGTLDHIHADATAGNVGNLVRRGEARSEDQIVDFFIGQVRIGGDEIVVDRLLANALTVDARAIVLKLDQDTARPVLGRKLDGAFRVLARRFAFSGVSMP